jgi:hypothetical protein
VAIQEGELIVNTYELKTTVYIIADSAKDAFDLFEQAIGGYAESPDPNDPLIVSSYIDDFSLGCGAPHPTDRLTYARCLEAAS